MQLFARDLITQQFDTIHADTPVDEAIKRIFTARIGPSGHKAVGLMVIDDTYSVIGTISIYYILYHLRPSYLNTGIDGNEVCWIGDEEEFVRELKQKTVRQVMNPNVLAIPPDEPLMSVIDQMIKNRVRRLAVVEHSKLIGMIYMSDIFHRLFGKGMPTKMSTK